MKTIAIINGTSKKAQVTRQQCEALGISWRMTAVPGEAAYLAHEAVKEGAGLLISCGGDGTLNECINGAMDRGALPCLMAQQPIGSANDFARKIGYSSLARVVELARAGEVRQLDLVSLTVDENIRYLANVSAAGIGAEIAATVNDRRRTWPHVVNYYSAILSWLVRYRPPALSIQWDDGQQEAECFLAAIGKGTYVGNGLGLLPQTRTADGLLGFTLVGNISVWDFLRYQGHLKKARVVPDARITYQQARGIRLMVRSGRLALDADGEFVTALSAGQSAKFQVLPGAMRWVG